MSNLNEKSDGDFKIVEEVEIDIVKYVAARKKEIDLLNDENFLSKENKQKSLFQLLPRHMRRRTMGYIRKRLPHRIRHLANIKPPKKANKRPSRKYRRRPSNLLNEYERRKRATKEKMWLETHIWHAKRFKMSESTYGYRLALRDNCKCKRAVLKCLKNYCCIHDESYHVCFEIEGREEDLISGLNRLCSPETGLTFAAKTSLQGKYEGRALLFEADKYPYGLIGPARFLWRPVMNGDDKKRTVWLWTHPAIQQTVHQQIRTLFQLCEERQIFDETMEVSTAANQDEDSPILKRRKMNESNEKTGNLSEEKEDKQNKNSVVSCELNEQTGIKLKSLKDQLIRFKLLGPLSTTILANVLQTVEPDSEENENFFKTQSEIWNKVKNSISDPNEITAATVIGLLVKDPRLVLPKKKSFNQINKQNKQINILSKNQLTQDLKDQLRNVNLSNSTIWNHDSIKTLNEAKMSTFKINKERCKYFLPSKSFEAVEKVSKVPIILIQNNVSSTSRFKQQQNLLSGWDVILPKSWAMSFWLSLVHFGARAIGLDELNYLTFESGNLSFPLEYFDTESGCVENEKITNELFRKFSSRPPSKRVNYLKSGFLSPFYFPFKSLLNLNEQLNQNGQFFILRNRQLINKLNNLFFTNSKRLDLSEADMKQLSACYVGVRVVHLGKGKIEKFSLLYKNDAAESLVGKNCFKTSLNSILNDYKKRVVEDEKEEGGKKKLTLNRLLRLKFNRNKILLMESYFERFHRELADVRGHEWPIGFSVNAGLSLLTSKYTANCFILGKTILDLAKTKFEHKQNLDLSLIKYQTPDSKRTLKNAKILNFLM